MSSDNKSLDSTVHDEKTNNAKTNNTNTTPPKPPIKETIGHLESFQDWFKQEFYYNDQIIEERLLSRLPFYPDSDGKRIASIINTNIDNDNYIHEFCIENIETDKPVLKDGVRDIILIHGYGASLGLFFGSFDKLSSIPGIRLHAIDLLGFGFSSRPKFPSIKGSTPEEVKEVENWFIDSFEQWREKRQINKFTLMGHSFGGYLSACYALKYQEKLANAGHILSKLVLISPVGVERNKNSFLKNIPNPNFKKKAEEDAQDPDLSFENEVYVDQEFITNPAYKNVDLNVESGKSSKRYRLIQHLWEKNYSIFGILRAMGPYKSKFLSTWVINRFAHIRNSDPDAFKDVHNYVYRSFTGKGSGEYALNRVFAFAAAAKLPLLDRCPDAFVRYNLPTFWMYGDQDWMNEEAGQEMTQDINALSKNAYGKKLASFKIIPNAGHHIYLDNPDGFADEIFKFIGYTQ